MLHRPKNRICPSCNCKICWNMRRHAPGAMKGRAPSITSTMARAAQKVSLSKRYFFAGAAGATPPRMALKNSDEAGSSTMTSLFLLKADL